MLPQFRVFLHNLLFRHQEGACFSKMAPELTPDTIATVKATVPVLKEHGVAIITRFYAILFERYPSVQRYFNM